MVIQLVTKRFIMTQKYKWFVFSKNQCILAIVIVLGVSCWNEKRPLLICKKNFNGLYKYPWCSVSRENSKFMGKANF
jgi:hypothetical protein